MQTYKPFKKRSEYILWSIALLVLIGSLTFTTVRVFMNGNICTTCVIDTVTYHNETNSLYVNLLAPRNATISLNCYVHNCSLYRDGENYKCLASSLIPSDECYHLKPLDIFLVVVNLIAILLWSRIAYLVIKVPWSQEPTDRIPRVVDCGEWGVFPTIRSTTVEEYDHCNLSEF